MSMKRIDAENQLPETGAQQAKDKRTGRQFRLRRNIPSTTSNPSRKQEDVLITRSITLSGKKTIPPFPAESKCTATKDFFVRYACPMEALPFVWRGIATEYPIGVVIWMPFRRA
jgi:hypothetical protein